MEIQLTPAYLDKPLFLRMAKDYIKTLSEYDRKIQWDEVSVSGWIWRTQFIMEDRTVQGFVVTELVPFSVYPDALCISEFYVVPESRKRGIGLGAVKALTGNRGEDVFLYILNENTQAKLFWTIVESKLGWKRIGRPEIRKEDGCELRVYKTR